MADSVSAPPLTRLIRPRWRGGDTTPWIPVWSRAAAMRAVRAAVVMPGLFAFTDKVIGNLQMATFAAFGSFATLVLAGFAGNRRQKLAAHAWLAVVGSVLVVIGTAVTATTWLAVLVTVPVAFAVFFAGVGGPNAASGTTAALLVYVLPAASAGKFSMVPDRLAGWWLASVVGTAAVLLFSPTAAGNKLRGAARNLAEALAAELDALVRGDATEATLAAGVEAKHELLAQFTSTPFRPTGLATADQALANAVELLEWCTSLVVDMVHERADLEGAAPVDLELLAATASVLRDAGTLFADVDASPPELERLEDLREQSLARLQAVSPDSDHFPARARLTFHAHAIATPALVIGADALVAAGLADARWIADARERWFGGPRAGPGGHRPLAGASKYAAVATPQASLRSVWFINSARGALALALAVAVADVTTVQHGFWVVLGTLSVLRTNAASTGSTALRALGGTAVGFLIGGALLLAIGSGQTALWVALPIAVFVAAYSPGTAPFAVGQAAFTVTVAVLFNLLVPVGWSVGVVRLEDVALGCAVSIVVGILFWPRGLASVVGDDLAGAFRAGANYLTQSLQWVSGLRTDAPDGAINAVRSGLRLDESLRGFLAEQGTKHIAKQELWRLVGGTMRLRLTAYAVAALPRDGAGGDAAAEAEIGRRAEILDTWYRQLATQLARPRRQTVTPLVAPSFDPELPSSRSDHVIWLSENINHLTEHLAELVAPAQHVAEIRRRPWWR